MLRIDQSSLINKLESILGKNPIFDLVQSFLNIEFKYRVDNELKDLLSDLRFGIPPGGLLSFVLLLNSLDSEIAHLNLRYYRNMNEVYIFNCKSVREISEILYKLGLEGSIDLIKPGTYTMCFVGRVGLNRKGQVYVEYS